MHPYLRNQPEIVRTLKNFQVDDLRFVQDGEIDALACSLPKLPQKRATDRLQRYRMSTASTHFRELRPDQVCSSISSEQVPFALEVHQEAVGSALVYPSLLAEQFQIKAGRRTINKFEDS